MKRALLLPLLLCLLVAPVCLRADEILVGQVCTDRCMHEHLTDWHVGFHFTLDTPSDADRLLISGENFPDSTTMVELTGPDNIDLKWTLNAPGFMDFSFNEFFPAGDYAVEVTNLKGVTTVVVGAAFNNVGCCGTMRGSAEIWVYGTPVASPEPSGIMLLASAVGAVTTVRRRWIGRT